MIPMDVAAPFVPINTHTTPTHEWRELGCVQGVSINEHSAFCIARRVDGTPMSTDSRNVCAGLPWWQKSNGLPGPRALSG